MITCYIVDDELHSIQILARYIEQTPGLELQGYSENPLEALETFRGSSYAAITFIDVDMPQLSGIDLSELIRNKTSVVFATAYDKYAVQAFERDALDYILKPIAYERFLKCINKINLKLRSNTGTEKSSTFDYFFIQYEAKGKIAKINYNDVICIQGLKNYIEIYTDNTKYTTYLMLRDFEESMPPTTFTRIHKSTIINLDKIIQIESNIIFLESKLEVVLGATFKDSFYDKLNEKLIRTKRQSGM